MCAFGTLDGGEVLWGATDRNAGKNTLGCWWNSLGNYWLRYHWDSLESLCLSHLLKSGKMQEFRCVWNSLRRCPWGTWESHGKITWVVGVNLLRSHSRGCRWHSMSRGHHRRSCTHTADHHMPQIERTKAHPSHWEEKPFLLGMTLQCPLLTKLNKVAKVKCLQGPPPVPQNRPSRIDLELRKINWLTGKRCNLFDMETISPAFFCLLFAWLIFFHPLTFHPSVSLYSKCISFRQYI